MAFEIDAVSPLRNASNIRNFLTEDSIVGTFSAGGATAVAGREDWIFEVDRINPDVPVDGLWECPRE